MVPFALLALIAGAQSPDFDAVRALPQGVERSQAVIAIVEAAPDAQLGEALQLGFDDFLAAAGRYDGEVALPLAEALHARADAPWSAMSLSLIHTRCGDPSRGVEVLRKAIVNVQEPATERDLVAALGLALVVSGQREPGLAAFGSAFCRGSDNAGVVLGRLALREGRLERARSIFRTLLRSTPPPAWALRGWGLSLLPAGARPQ